VRGAFRTHAILLPPAACVAAAAGADIKEMQPLTYAGNLRTNFIKHWTRVTESRKPVIAAVSGYAVLSAPEATSELDSV